VVLEGLVPLVLRHENVTRADLEGLDDGLAACGARVGGALGGVGLWGGQMRSKSFERGSVTQWGGTRSHPWRGSSQAAHTSLPNVMVDPLNHGGDDMHLEAVSTRRVRRGDPNWMCDGCVRPYEHAAAASRPRTMRV
jgi:hypothetical protein